MRNARLILFPKDLTVECGGELSDFAWGELIEKAGVDQENLAKRNLIF